MNKAPFFGLFFLLLLGIALFLGYCTWGVLTQCTPIAMFFFIQCLQTLGFYLLLGLGLGIPLLFLATIFSWLQVILLISGNIDPHLAKEGFFNVLRTLCGLKTPTFPVGK